MCLGKMERAVCLPARNNIKQDHYYSLTQTPRFTVLISNLLYYSKSNVNTFKNLDFFILCYYFCFFLFTCAISFYLFCAFSFEKNTSTQSNISNPTEIAFEISFTVWYEIQFSQLWLKLKMSFYFSIQQSQQQANKQHVLKT